MAAKPGKGLRRATRAVVGKNQRPCEQADAAADPVRPARVKKCAASDSFGEIPKKIFETLVVIGFALRYHSKRRTAGWSPACRRVRRAGQDSALCRRSPTLDGTVRARIIGAFALFVSNLT
ncbi:hypothetical protein [Burkholderia sp. Ac-20353]|uniref:hypothetical protein n=1 Tax=Burkholderia sp. Ac-20353 TaxID=2703894 RepID=UPI00197B7581|nr:hypothetical protein [Burkholderia sp. Ac-20353]MBN3792673.1 hypothetical protein [Burkholderia sp. Ac-20353]